MPSPILQGQIVSLRGVVSVIDSKGQPHALKTGDIILAGEHVVLQAGAMLTVAREGGQNLTVDGPRDLTLAPEVLQAQTTDQTETAVAKPTPTAQSILTELEQGQDPFANLPTAAAGLTAGSSEEGSHSFVRLLRISESLQVTPADNATPVATAGNPTVATNTLPLAVDTQGLTQSALTPDAPVVIIRDHAGLIGPSDENQGKVTVSVLLGTDVQPGDIITLQSSTGDNLTHTVTPQDLNTANPSVDFQVDAPASGTLNVSATVTNPQGAVSAPGRDQGTVDTTAPNAPLVHIIDHAGLIGSSDEHQGKVSVSVALDSSVSVGDIVTLQSSTGDLLTHTVSAQDLSGAHPSVDFQVDAPASGVLSVSATVTDLAGNVSPPGSNLGTVDTTAPNAPDVGIVDHDGLIGPSDENQGKVTVVVGLDNSVVVGDIVTLQSSTGDLLTHTVTAQDLGNAPPSVSFQVDAPPLGVLSVSATITDLAGNVSPPGSDQGTVDTQASITLSSDGSVGGVYNLADSRAVTVSGTTSGVETGQTVTVTFSDGTHTVTETTSVGANGTWAITPASLASLSDGPITVSANTVNLAGASASTSHHDTLDTLAAIAISNDGSVGGVYNLADSRAVSVTGTVSGVEAGQLVTVTFSDGTHTVSETTTVGANGSWTVTPTSLATLSDGPITVNATTADQAGNPASTSDHDTLDTTAAIAISSDGSVAGVYNLADSRAVTVTGTSSGVEAGQTVTVSFSDGTHTVSETTTVSANGTWAITPASLATLSDGPITVSAATADQAGNPTSASHHDTLDTLATIAISNDGSVGGVYNLADSRAVAVTGTVTGVESGQLVTVTFSDGTHSVNTVATVGANGSWTVTPASLATLADGPITISATTADRAGNPASAGTHDTLDTLASIAISSDGSVGGVYNLADSHAVTVTGTTTGVEAGQTVTVSFSDGTHTVSETTTIGANGSWSVTPASLATLSDGPISVSAATADQAGNPANATNHDSLDTLATIAISSDGSVGGVYNLADSRAVTVTGTTSGVEAGQTVTVSFSDGTHSVTETTTVGANGSWSVTPASLATLSDGPITVSAATADQAGNPANTSNHDALDTLAAITISSDGSVGGVYNLADSRAVTVTGTTSGVEAGQTITVSFSDGTHTVSETTTVSANGTWAITPANLAPLSDGPITVSATTADQAGNPANTSHHDTLDTFAAITISNDGSVGGVYNLADSRAVTVTGTTSGVESGQTVTVTFTDGTHTVTENTTVGANGGWSVTPASLAALTDGPITVSAAAADQAGNPASASHHDTLDTFAAIAISSDGSVGGVYNLADSHSVTVSGTASGVEIGQQVTVSFSDGTHSVTETTTVGTNGSWLITQANLSSLSDGPITVSAATVDQAGNPASTSNHDSLDTLAAIAISSDGSVGGVYNLADSRAVTVTGTTTGVEAGQTVTVSFSDGTHTLSETTTVGANGSWAITPANLATLSDGPISLSATTADQAGNPASASHHDTLDTLATIAISSDGSVGGVYNLADSRAVTVTGTTTGVEAGQSVTVSFSDGTHTVSETTTIGANGSWSVTPASLATLSDGPITVSAATADQAGNPASTSHHDTLDTLATIAITSDGSVAGVYNLADSRAVTVTGTTTGVEAGQTVTVTFTDGTHSVTETTTVGANGGWSATPANLATLTDGPISVSAATADQAGNPASASDHDTLDTLATIAITSDGSVAGVYNLADSRAVTVTGTTSGVESGQTVTVTFTDGTHTVTENTTVGANGGWSVTPASLAALTDGPITVSAAAADQAGNLANASNHDTLDTFAAIAITSDGSIGGVYNLADSRAVTVSGTTSGVEAGQTVTVTFSDGTHNVTETTTVGANGNWSVTPASLATLSDGPITVSATTADQAGNPASASHHDTLDTLATIAITSDGSIAGVYNLADSRAATVSGTTTGVEAGQTVTVTFSDGTHMVSETTTVGANGSWSVTPASLATLRDGPITVSAATADQAGNPANISNNDNLDTHATIAISNDGSVGGLYNRADSGAVIVSGTATGVEAGQLVTVAFSDGTHTVTQTATVGANGSWTSSPVNLAPLADGSLTLTASTTDRAGNPASASRGETLDTQASIFIASDGSVSGVYNLADRGAVTVSGTVSGVQAGQTVTVTFADSANHTITATTTVGMNGSWSVSPENLATLKDGQVTVTASTTDLAGNPASASNLDTLDTHATIAITSDGSVAGVYNLADSRAVTVSGTVSGVESGQTVTVTFSDGTHSVTETTTVAANGSWSAPPANLSSLTDGPIAVSAATADRAGNPASASHSDTLDTTATVFIASDGSVNGVYNLADSGAVIVSGTVAGVEAGQTIVVTFTDAANDTVTETTTVGANGSWSTPAADLGFLTDGPVTVTASTIDRAGNPASVSNNDTLDTQASIAITSDGSINGVYNLADSGAVAVNGTATGVEAGQTVTVTFTDAANHTVSATALVGANGAWSVNAVNLASLTDGNITLSATTADRAGNPASASRSDTLDTQAAIAIASDGSIGGVYDQADSGAVVVSGTVSGVEPGQIVSVIFADADNNTITETTTISATGTWAIFPVNLGSLVDGPITVTASTADRAGNPASASHSDTLDTQSAFTLMGLHLGGAAVAPGGTLDLALTPTDQNLLSQGESVHLSASTGVETTLHLSDGLLIDEAGQSYSYLSGVIGFPLASGADVVSVSATVSDEHGNTSNTVSAVLLSGGSNDAVSGLLGGETFQFTLSFNGNANSPHVATINNFNPTDSTSNGAENILDLRDLLVGESHAPTAGSSIGNLDSYLHFSSSSQNGVTSTTIHISETGQFGNGGTLAQDTAQIVLQNVDLLHSASGSLQSDQAILQNLLASGKLMTD